MYDRTSKNKTATKYQKVPLTSTKVAKLGKAIAYRRDHRSAIHGYSMELEKLEALENPAKTNLTWIHQTGPLSSAGDFGFLVVENFPRAIRCQILMFGCGLALVVDGIV
jgi:hypothetical protein